MEITITSLDQDKNEMRNFPWTGTKLILDLQRLEIDASINHVGLLSVFSKMKGLRNLEIKNSIMVSVDRIGSLFFDPEK